MCDLVVRCCFFASRRRHTRCALVTGVQTCALPICDMGPVADRVEIGWRLARDCWGAGFASEAARGAAAWTFENLPDDEIRAITWRGNVRSRAVMERLGMRYRAERKSTRLKPSH